MSTSFAAQRAFVFRAAGGLTGDGQDQPTSSTARPTAVDRPPLNGPPARVPPALPASATPSPRAATVLLAGCGASVAADTTTDHQRPSTSTSTSAVATTDGTTVDDVLADDVAVETGDTSYDEADATTVTLDGTTATSDSDAVTSRTAR